jgi:hypothetical protein
MLMSDSSTRGCHWNRNELHLRTHSDGMGASCRPGNSLAVYRCIEVPLVPKERFRSLSSTVGAMADKDHLWPSGKHVMTQLSFKLQERS